MYFIFPQLLLAFLQTLSHTLPVEHPGRMAMLTSLFIGTSVTQAGIAVHIPKSSESMSLLQIYMAMMSCNLVVALIITFVMMYAVLRYPNAEPSISAMIFAFFSIVWPEKHRHHRHKATVEDNHADSNEDSDEDPTTRYNTKTCHSNSDQKISKKENSNTDLLGSILRNRSASSSFHEKATLDQLIKTTPDPVLRSERGRSSLVSKKHLALQNCLSQETPEDEDVPGVKGTLDAMSPTSPNVFEDINMTLNYNSPFVGFSDGCSCGRMSNNNASYLRRMSQIQFSKDAKRVRDKRKMDAKFRDLKRRWLLYCVALDKVLMYCNAVWNIACPIVLFAIVPATGAPLTYHMEVPNY